MELKVGSAVIALLQGDITRIKADAVVNAANPTLLGGGGVDGAIHRVGGPAILEACRGLGGCEPGGAKITSGGDLPADYVIHAVGPIWHGGGQGEAQLLASAYRRSLELASAQGLKTIAFPSLSTGVYGYPIEKAAKIALSAIRDYVVGHPGIERVTVVLFTASDLAVYRAELARISAV